MIKKHSIIDFVMTQIAKQRKTVFLWVPVFMGLGIVGYFQSDIEASPFVIGAALFLCALGVSKTVHDYRKNGSYFALILLIVTTCLALMVLGYGLADYRTKSLNTPMIEAGLKPQIIEGHIEKLVMLDGGKAKRVVLRNIHYQGQKLRVRLKTYHFKGDDWRVGDRVAVKAKLMAPSEPVMPGGFDFRFKAYYEGLSAVGFTMGTAQLLVQSDVKSDHIQSFRDHIGVRLYDTMQPRYAGIAQALLTGERAGIAKGDTESLRVSGLAHLLAISGLHIGLVAGCVFFFVRLFLVLIPGFGIRYPIKKYAAACAIVIAFGYMVLAGATVPTVRAFIMTSLVLMAVILDRSAMNMRLVALAAIIVMVTTPEAVIGPSFVLSFAAVSALIAFYQGMGRQWFVSVNAYSPIMKPIFYVVGIVMTTLIATLATAPFSVMFFNRFAMYSVLSNILAMPLMSIIVMPFGLLATLVIPMSWDGHLWRIMEWGIVHIVTVADVVSSYDGADLHLPSFGFIDTILICFGFLVLVLWQGVLRWVGLVFILAGFMIPQFDSSKHILISDKMQAIMIVDKSVDEIYLIGKANSYLKANWLQHFGYSKDVDILSYNKGDNMPQSLGRCDDMSCVVHLEGYKIAIIHDSLSIQSACQSADIIISKIPINEFKACQKPHVIDYFDIWRSGATMLKLNNNQYLTKVVRN